MAQTAETLRKGVEFHNSGQLHQAEDEYRKVLRVDPQHPDALHLLGVLRHQRGEPATAVEYIGKAVAINAGNSAYHTNLAAAHQALNQFRQAENCCRRAIQLEPGHAEAHYNLGVALESQSELDAAAESYRKTIELKPAIAEAHLNLGNILRSRGLLTEAEQCFRSAIAARPGYAPAHYNLGNILHGRQQNEAAIECYRQALECDPQYHDALFNLAVMLDLCGRRSEAVAAYRDVLLRNPRMAEAALKLGAILSSQGELAESAAAFQQALDIRPGDERLWNNLGQVRQLQGEASEAEICFRRALEIRPDFASAWNNLAVAQRALGQGDAAIGAFWKALELDPLHVHANVNLGTVLVNSGELSEAAACFNRALERDPANSKARILGACILPQVYSSTAELQEYRRKLTENVRRLLSDGVRLKPEAELMINTFYLPYQGLNDRELQRNLARLYPVPVESSAAFLQRCGEPVAAGPGRTAKVRVGFVSHHFRSHTIGHLMRGLLAGLSRSRFSVTVFSFGDHQDEVAQAIRAAADEFIVLPLAADPAREIVARQRLDVLFYADIGMDPYAYSLAFHRLAPVQCVTWGHPVTTGIPNIDYFVSSELLEPADGNEHYTEELVRLKGLPTYYYRPVLTGDLPDRARLGLPADYHVYLCPQSLFKFHPEFDAVLKEILARDPRGWLVLVEGLEPGWSDTLRARFRRSFPESADRVQFVPRAGRGEFLALMAACDVMLDPLHFGGGNTTYEALALGTPIVTLPSGFMRGRVTAACYRKMGLDECVAASTAEYVELALRLANDLGYRRAVREKILAGNHVLYEDHESLHELEAFLESAVAWVRQPTPAPERTPGDENRQGDKEQGRQGDSATLSPSPAPAADTGNAGQLPAHRTINPASSPCRPCSPAPWLSSNRETAPSVAETVPAEPTIPDSGLSHLLRSSTCPACGHHVAVPFYDGGRQPLATVAWPRTADEARSMKRLPLEFVRCVDCGHVYNSRFDYAEVPYSQKPNLMFNRGVIWSDHLRRVRKLILQSLPERPVVVEIGCGEGHLLRALAESRPAGRYIGFDPSGVTNTGGGMIEARRELFIPSRHLAELRPDLMISRHVLEHLMNPLGFVQEISFAASWEELETRLFIEVPCIDQVIRIGRTVDFFYEHNSNFTTASLERLLARCASEVEIVERGYGDEVVFGLAQFRRRHDQVRFASEAITFCERTTAHQQSIARDVDELARSGRRVAVWGGTGKAAAFVNQNGLDAQRFPLVVDSDLDKAGTYVPGSGQEIAYRDILIRYPADVILIATQWRAADIVAEIERCGIVCQSILIEHEGRLVDYFSGHHPYRSVGKAA